MKKLTTQNKYMLILVWLALISASLTWNIYQAREFQRFVYLETARSFFELIVTTRQWNSNMGGVYVPVSDTVQPNPYLTVPDRDLKMPDGLVLTKINPAFMTRMISEMAAKKNNAQFYITSLKPINPANAPRAWEAEALKSFETGSQKEYFRFEDQGHSFSYMAPLITQPSCLACHQKQGYKEGDIRGGISITMKTQEANILPLLTSHLVIGLIGTVLIFLFSSRLESAVRLLEKQSSQDGLTQIFNRSYFDAYFQREFLRSRRQKHPLSLLLCDVDFFKSYNDLYGHQVGDQALVKIAGTLSGQLKRPADLVARYGGEEFVVVLPETPLEGALVIAEHLRAAVEAIGIVHSENKVSPVATISIGCWTYTGESIPLEEVLQKADKALYLAKAGGRNSVIAFGR